MNIKKRHYIGYLIIWDFIQYFQFDIFVICLTYRVTHKEWYKSFYCYKYLYATVDLFFSQIWVRESFSNQHILRILGWYERLKSHLLGVTLYINKIEKWKKVLVQECKSLANFLLINNYIFLQMKPKKNMKGDYINTMKTTFLFKIWLLTTFFRTTSLQVIEEKLF